MFSEKQTQVCKQIQSRLSRKNVKVGLPELRSAYDHAVADDQNPTDYEIENIFQSFLPTDLTVTAKGEIIDNRQDDQAKNAIIPQQQRYEMIATQFEATDIVLSQTEIEQIDDNISEFTDYRTFIKQVVIHAKEWVTAHNDAILEDVADQKRELQRFMVSERQRLDQGVANTLNTVNVEMKETGRFLRQLEETIKQKLAVPSKADR